jgi:hypothetical protein
MFGDRKKESTEASIMNVLLEDDGSGYWNPSDKKLTVADHQSHAAHADSQAYAKHQEGDDHMAQARLHLKKGNKQGYLDSHMEAGHARQSAHGHEHQAIRHRLEAHVKAGHKVSDFPG